MPGKKIDFDVVREVAMALPDVEVTGRGAIALKAGGKLMACTAIHKSAEPNTLMVRITPEQRAELIEAEPRIYYVTDHYVNYPSVLVRLSQIDRTALTDLLKMACRFVNAKTKQVGEGRPAGRRDRLKPAPTKSRTKRAPAD